MPVIRPFRGIRYNPEISGDFSEVVAPPYDIIYDEWREKLYARNPYNSIRLIKTKEKPADGEDENKYTRAARYIESWIREGVLKYEDDPAIYVCADSYDWSINWNNHRSLGHSDNYPNNRVWSFWIIDNVHARSVFMTVRFQSSKSHSKICSMLLK